MPEDNIAQILLNLSEVKMAQILLNCARGEYGSNTPKFVRGEYVVRQSFGLEAQFRLWRNEHIL